MITVSGAKRLLVSGSMLVLLTACAMAPESFTAAELAQAGKDDRAEMFNANEPLAGRMTISEAIARALKYNLDRRAKSMEEALAANQTKVDRWDLLPKLVADAGATTRSVPHATVSEDLNTHVRGTNPTFSTDPDNATADLGLSWNVLDFGLSYFSAKQNADRVLIAGERKRRAVHNLVQEVRFAYWRAAAYQVLKGEVSRAIADARVGLDRARSVERENLSAPLEALQYQKSLLETLRQLTTLQQELSTAEIELAALVNVPPGTAIPLDVPSRLKVPAWTIGLDRMEELAFLGNADLREQGYLARIAANDTRKAIARLFPGITFSASHQQDRNSFLVDNNWYEAGAKLSWNLMNLISAPDTIAFSKSGEEVVKAKRLALRMAVLAQVHISERQFRNAVDQFRQSDELWRVDRRLFELSDARTANDAQGILQRVAERTALITSALRRFQAYAQVEQAYAKMQTSVGQDLMPDVVASYEIKDLTATVAERLAAWNEFGRTGEIPPAAPALPVAADKVKSVAVAAAAGPAR